jgi:hypothetical protein
MLAVLQLADSEIVRIVMHPDGGSKNNEMLYAWLHNSVFR